MEEILVVEDEAITAINIQRKLQKLGYLVPAIASSGEEAIALIKKTKPNLVLMDISLNGKMDGAETGQYIANNYHIPIVFLTAYSDADTINRAKMSVPYGYLTKPFENSDLRIVVELALFKYKMEMENEAESMRLKNEFLENMTHEIRTPLNGIIGFAEVLYNGTFGKLNSEQNEFLESMLSNLHFLLRLLSDILDLTQAEVKQIKFHPEKIDITSLIDEIINSQRKMIEDKKIKLNITIDPSLPEIIIDPKQIENIIFHYISNAIKFSHDSGTVTIGVFPAKEGLFCIEVKDEGIGIKDEHINQLFVPFKQLDMSAAKKYQGAGVGLAVSRRMVELLGGQVSVESTFGKGTTFTITLPCNPQKITHE